LWSSGGLSVRAGCARFGERRSPQEKAGIHRTYLSDVERGSRNICLLNIERMAAALQIRLSALFAAVERP
jgi:hypothetical protein